MPLHPVPPVVRRLAAAGLLALVALGAVTGEAWAHPLGNFTINRYSRLDAGASQLHVTYIVDMAEIPTHAERTAMDLNGDGALSVEELDTYRTNTATELAQHLSLSVAGQQVPLTVSTIALSFPAGQAGLPTLRFVINLTATIPNAGAAQVIYQDGNYPDRIGWREIVAVALNGASLKDATVPAQDVTKALTAYPQDLLANPLQVTNASFVLEPAAGLSGGAVQPSDSVAAVTAAGRPVDPFAELITIPSLGFDAIALALLAAMGWGALHALSPGHGKTIVAAYLVGTRGTSLHALFLGLTTTLTHTAGVFAVGLVALTLSRFVVPEQLYPWLSTASGVIVIVIGVSLVRQRMAGNRGHSHSHVPGVAHEHAGAWHVHGGGANQSPMIDQQAQGEKPLTWRSLLALGVSGGLLPCPSALVLMLGAISLHRIGFGLMLILAFSIGLAGVLTLVGILLVHAGKLFERFPESGRITQLAPIGSAVFITAAGFLITIQALAQTGLLPT